VLCSSFGQRHRSLLRTVHEHDPLDGDAAAPDRRPDLRQQCPLGDDDPGVRESRYWICSGAEVL
jgi:hypothetical protein